MKKNKFLLLLLVATFLLLLFIILSSKILTIKSGSIDGEQKENSIQEAVEMEKVRSDYLTALRQITLSFDNNVRNFEDLISATGVEFDQLKVDDKLKQIVSLEDSLTALLVPPEYRKVHLNLVLQFTRIALEDDPIEVLKNLKQISLDLNAQ